MSRGEVYSSSIGIVDSTSEAISRFISMPNAPIIPVVLRILEGILVLKSISGLNRLKLSTRVRGSFSVSSPEKSINLPTLKSLPSFLRCSFRSVTSSAMASAVPPTPSAAIAARRLLPVIDASSRKLSFNSRPFVSANSAFCILRVAAYPSARDILSMLRCISSCNILSKELANPVTKPVPKPITVSVPLSL